jgi:hypothetical protein
MVSNMSSNITSEPSLMEFYNPEDPLDKRQRAAQLIEAVLDERIEPRIAINRWPESTTLPDASMFCAYQALWHFEADEEKHRSEMFYLDAQLELLRQIACFLKQGKDLPPYIIRMYSADHQTRFYYYRSWWEDSIHLLLQAWLRFILFWRQTWQLCLPWH